MRFSYYKIANRIVSCNAIIAFCEAILVQFDKHPRGRGNEILTFNLLTLYLYELHINSTTIRNIYINLLCLVHKIKFRKSNIKFL